MSERQRVEIRYNDHFQPCFDWKGRYLLMYGSAGSGKSISAAQKTIMRAFTEPGIRGLICRETENSIKESCYQEVKKIAEPLGARCIKSPMQISFPNGSELLFKGLDDPEKIKSFSSPSFIWVEEATESKLHKINQLDLRMRGESPFYYQMILTFNPVDECNYLRQFIDNNKDNHDLYVHHSTFRDNQFIDDSYINLLENRIAGDENLKRIYVDGLWGRMRTNNEFYSDFNYTQHVGTCEFDPNLPVHISFDFNSVPYMTLEIFQIKKLGEKQFRIEAIDEICLSNPHNHTEALCERFVSDYGMKCRYVYYYGDSTGKSTKTMVSRIGKEIQRNDHEIIEAVLRKYLSNDSKRIPLSNPRILSRRDFMNKLFRGYVPGIEFRVSPKCVNLIADFGGVQQDIDGGKLKKRVKDSEKGISYEEYGHTSDAAEYFIMELLKSYQ